MGCRTRSMSRKVVGSSVEHGRTVGVDHGVVYRHEKTAQLN